MLDTFLNHSCWASFDDCMSALADKLRKLGNKQTLEVEFKFVRAILYPPPEGEVFLPKFSEKGRVRVVDYSSGQVLQPAVCFLLSLVPRYFL